MGCCSTDFPKWLASVMASKMSIVPSGCRSAFGFQLGLSGVALSAFVKSIASKMSTMKSPLRSGARWPLQS